MKNTITENIELIKNLLLSHKHILNIEELSVLTGMSKSNIYKLTSARTIPHYKKDEGSKVIYFKRREIEIWLTAHKVKTSTELEAEALNLMTRKMKRNATK